jgi:hypothetical protein
MRKILIWSLAVLYGCAASPEQFSTFSTSERQAEICNNSAPQRDRTERLNNLNSEISGLRGIISRGYRVHQQCKQVAYESPMCAGFKEEIKRACLPWYKNECTDIPVPIDKAAEQKALIKMESTYRALFAENRRSRDYCFDAVSQMSVGEAFAFYSAKQEPTPSNYAAERALPSSSIECALSVKTRSVQGAVSQRIIFVNDLPSAEVEIYYVSGNGKRIVMGALKPGNELPIKSFTGHGFVVMNKATGSCEGSHRVGSKEVILVSQLK